MGEALAECVTERHRRRLGRNVHHITIDLYPTDEPTHDMQKLTFFNAHYETSRYLPVAGSLTFNHEPEQYRAPRDQPPKNNPPKTTHASRTARSAPPAAELQTHSLRPPLPLRAPRSRKGAVTGAAADALTTGARTRD